MLDDALGEQLRNARPFNASTSDPLPEHAEKVLEAILQSDTDMKFVSAEPVSSGTHRNNFNFKRVVTLLSGAAAIFALFTLVTVLFLPGTPSAAGTPIPLTFTPVKGTATQQMADFARKLTAMTDHRPTDDLYVTSWHLAIDVDGITNTRVLPQQLTISFLPNNDVRVLTEAGSSYDLMLRSDPRYKPGNVIADETWEAMPGPPNTQDLMEQYFTEVWGIPPGSSSWEYFSVIPSLYQFASMDRIQEASLLGFLGSLPDIALAGETVDRLGRPGIGVTSSENKEAALIEVLIFSQQTGQLLSAESIYVGADRSDIPTPYVQNYTAFERPNQ